MFSGFQKLGLRPKNSSTLRPEQMLEEAMGHINQSFANSNEKTALDRLAGLKSRRDPPSFDFTGSDGYILRVKVLSPDQRGPGKESDDHGPQMFTVLEKATHINGYPCVKTNEGDLVFVYDPTVTSAETIYQGHGNFVDPQLSAQGVSRVTKKNLLEHVPRPMNAFIIYRNTEMKAVRQKYPGIGNNDVSRIVGQRWRELDPKIREHYKDLAAKSAQEHHVKHPGYKYTPRKPEDVVRRRKKSATVGDNTEHIRNPAIHRSSSLAIPSPPPPPPPPPPHPEIQYQSPGYLNLDDLTNIWVQEPTAQNFDALMEGFDHALGVATDKNLVGF
nr:MAT1-2-1 protein [Morchella eximia]